MRFKLCAVALSIALAPQLHAQNADSTAIIAVVKKLFDGMRTRDTASMRALFVPQARMLGIRGDTSLSANPVDGWLTSVARNPNGPVLDERTWGYEVRVDANIAQAWMQYALYSGTTFVHCGVDAFDLVKLRGEWKIVAVMDTRRTVGCQTQGGLTDRAPPTRLRDSARLPGHGLGTKLELHTVTLTAQLGPRLVRRPDRLRDQRR